MPLTELTTVTGPGIHTQSNINSHNINSTGSITAVSFDGALAASNLTGALPAISGENLTNLPAGLGTALSQTQSSPLSQLYYVNDTLHITIETVVQLPDSSSNAYTNYSNIEVGDNINLTIGDDVNLVPDVLELGIQ